MRFFNRRHPDNFMIYNCTSECSYPIEPFGGNVHRVAIDDHNVPTLETIVQACRLCEEQRSRNPEIVFVFHCRGGKGRTGLMLCSWLLWSRHCRSADESLELWARRRTDETIRGKAQGVQTQSQVRYVHYMEQLLTSGRPLSRQPRPLRHLLLKNVLPDKLPAPEGCLPWVVLTFVGPFGNVILDTKHAAGGAMASCVSQRDADVVVELDGYVVQGDVKVEVFVDKGVGDEYLMREPMPADAAALLGSGALGSPQSARSAKKSRKGSLVPGSITYATTSLKNAASSVNNGVFGAQGIDGAPPAPGTDRQLVLYAWIHVEMEPGSEQTVELPAHLLDKGKKAIFKRLKQRGVSVVLQFGEAAKKRMTLASPGRTSADADAPAPSPAKAGGGPCWRSVAMGETATESSSNQSTGSSAGTAALERARNAAASAKSARFAAAAAPEACRPAALLVPSETGSKKAHFSELE